MNVINNQPSPRHNNKRPAQPRLLNRATLALYYLMAALVAFSLVLTGPRLSQAASTITGTVYRDYNENGIYETSASAYSEIGQGGVTVRAYNAANTLVGTATTAANGTYSLDVGSPTAVRVEFDQTTFPTGAQPSVHGAGTGGASTGTTVQFVTSPTTQVDLGINVPSDYCKPATGGTIPQIITACYALGAYNDATNVSNKGTIYAVPYNVADGTKETAQTMQANAGQVGSVFGVAYQRTSQSIFSAAFQKRHMSYGPNGTGAIYRTNQAAALPNGSLFVDLNASGILGTNATGVDPHSVTALPAIDFNVDAASFKVATKIGLGSLTISGDSSTLFTVNLASRELISIPLGANPASPTAPGSAAALNATPTATQVGHFTMPGTGSALPGATSGCSVNDVRPFAASWHENKVYVGIVCSQEFTASDPAEAYIYTFDPTTSTFGSAPVMEFPLTYTKGQDAFGFTTFPGPNNKWNPWVGTYNGPVVTGTNSASYSYPEAILSDITFTNGDMIIGLRDRLGDQAGPFTADPTNADGRVEAIAAGDILRASPNTVTPGTWVLENNAQQGTNGRAFGASAGAGNGQGPGGGEFYYQDDYITGGTCCHEDTGNGGLVKYPGQPDVVMAQMDLYAFRSGGFGWYSDKAGTKSKAYEIFPNDTPGGNATGPGYYVAGNRFEKAEGLGGVALTCDTAPIEIGNRLWLDTNNNGIQDVGETILSGVTVSLYDGGTKVSTGTVTTDANGEYYFNSSNVTGGLLPNHAYTVKFDNAADYTTGPLKGLQLAKYQAAAPSGYTGQVTTIDSDAQPVTPGSPISASNLAQISLTTGTAGFNNHTYDAGFLNGLKLGNYVWKDFDNSGKVNGSGPLDETKSGVAGVTVNLYKPDPSTGNFNPIPGNLLATTTTDASGLYLFDSTTTPTLVAGSYFVQLNPTNFTGSGPLVGYTSSTGGPAGTYEAGLPSPDVATGSSDNTDHGKAVANQGIVTNKLTLAAATDRLDVDFGVVPQMRIGNLVWKDTNDSGVVDSGETGVASVKVNLYQDTNSNGVFDTGGTDVLIASTTTDTAGRYYFNNLVPGNYFIEIDSSNFTGAGKLVGYTSSTGGAGSPYETGLVTPATGINDTDHGKKEAVGLAVVSSVINLVGNSAPTGDEGDALPFSGTDNNSNVTIDFGFVPPVSASTLRLGNYVWFDTNNNGLVDNSETGIAGVTVQLYLDANGNGVIDAAENTPVQTATTNSNGYYEFDNLAATTGGADYLVDIPASNFTGAGKLVNYVSSTGGPGSPNETALTTAGAASTTNNVDHGKASGGAAGDVVSQKIVLTVGNAPTGDEADATAWASGDTNSNMTIDFGFTQPMRIGNVVWFDTNNNGLHDAGETTYPNGATLTLYEDTNKNGVFDPGTDLAVTGQTATTNASGQYYFNNVLPGNYFVIVDATNFTGAGKLVGYTSSTGGAGSPYEDNLPSVASTVNNSDHGATTTTTTTPAVASNLVQLVAGAAPTGEETDTPTPPAFTGGDANSNLTIDFGFISNPFRIGNYIWNDVNNDGLVTTGESGIAGVTVQLYDVTGAATLAGTTTTDGTGHYIFDNTDVTIAGGLVAGRKYQVRIPASNFTAGNPLNGFSSSSVAGAANTNNQNQGTPLNTTNAVISGPTITLTAAGQPTGDEADAPVTTTADNNSNLVQDFGFNTTAATLRIGNYVWKDTNNNGVVDGAETGIAGVKVNLILDLNGNGTVDAGDNVIATTTTSDSTDPKGAGHYYFNNLSANTGSQAYLVQIDATNFNVGQPLAALLSSDGGAGKPYENLTGGESYTNNIDHGNTVAGQGVLSRPIVLAVGGAPSGDEADAPAYPGGDANSNLTVDFGFAQKMRIGNLVWSDTNNNGLLDGSETPIPGVKLNLYYDTNNNGTFDSGDQLVPGAGQQTTDSGGHYEFNNLLPGKYFVQVDPSNFTSGGVLQNRASSASTPGGNNANNGRAVSGSGVASSLITLTDSTAPTNDEADASAAPNGDNNSNQSVDFGFTPTPTSVQLAYVQIKSNLIEWATATEVDNLGFNVYFKPTTGGETVKLNKAIIPSTEITGQRLVEYRLEVATPAGQYFLEEVSLSGATKQYGPFQPGQTWGERAATAKAAPAAAPAQSLAAAVKPDKPLLLVNHSFNLQTDKAGLYHLTYEYLNAQGLDFTGVLPATIGMTNGGQPVGLNVVTTKPESFGPGDYIEWQAQAFHNIYTDYNTYVLNVGDGANTALGPAATGPANASATARIEHNSFYWGSADANTDPWFWDYISTYASSMSDKQFGFDLPTLTSGGGATGLKIYLRGLTSDPAVAQNHRVHAWLNGNDLGTVVFGGQNAGVLQTTGTRAIGPTGNSLRLTIEKVDGTSLPYDTVLFDYLEFTYPTNPTPAIEAVKSVRLHQPTPYRASNKVDYLVIAHPAFLGGIQPLVDLHNAEGLRVKVVDVNAIYDNYSNGIVDAKAIGSYLSDQQKEGLKYVLLVGGDSYDPMNYYSSLPNYAGSSPSFVPSLYTVDNFHFRAPSDQLLIGTTSGVAIGRLPAQSVEELRTMVNKTVSLASASRNHSLSNAATFVADDGADFSGLNDTLAAGANGYNVEKDYLGSNLSRDQLRARLTSRINAGNLLVNYAGHSGTNAWGLQTFYRQSDITALSNTSQPLVVVQWACYNSYYVSPYSRSMAETWLTANGGAAFVLGSTDQNLTADQTELATRFYQNLAGGKLSLGESLAKAKTDMLAANPTLTDIAQGYAILGDPAIKL